MDLLPLVTNAQGWTFDHAIAINNKGVIIGEGVVNGELHGFILTPQPPSRIPTPPVITIRATPDTLWPPNGKMVLVTIAGTITYAGSGVNPNTAAYVVTDEYRQVQPKGSVAPRADGNYSFTIQLQASRNGNDRDGRQYTITVSAHDLAGNEGVGTASVIVPHDQRN
jgi:hypothetical protein